MSSGDQQIPIPSDTQNTKSTNNNVVRRERPSRACTVRSAARLHAAAAAEAVIVAAQRKQKRKFRAPPRQVESPSPPPSPPQDSKCSKIVTQLVMEPEPAQLPRWTIRNMWEFASILNFLNVFRSLLNIKVEFSAEELETALLTPNSTLADIHIPLLKGIPPITRMALGQTTWITVLCRKLRDWWHWVADGELPITASHGTEIEAYNVLPPGVRVVILKALCDIRVEQEDIRNYIDNSIKQGVHLSTFRKERIGGDSHGISFWYEDDPVIGQRLYREIRKVEVKKGKGKSVQPIPISCYQWETAATNLDEFQDVSEKLFSSKNRTEASLGKKLKFDVLPEVEKVLKTKEKLLKKQHRQTLLLDNMISVDGLPPGRSLRGRKHVSYTFDDYDKSINEAINVTKRKQSPPETTVRRDGMRSDISTNGELGGPSQFSEHSFSMLSPESYDRDEIDEDLTYETLGRGSQRRQRPGRYPAKEFVEELSDNDAEFDSDEEIVGEAVYDDEYLKRRKGTRKMSSGSEGDEEYHWEGENVEEEEEEEEEDDYSLSTSEDSDERMSDDSGKRKMSKKLPGRTRRGFKLRSVNEFDSGLRRSNRATRNRVDYRKLEVSDSETESLKPEKSNASDEHTDASDKEEFSIDSESEESEASDIQYRDEASDEEQPGASDEEQPGASDEEQPEASDEEQPGAMDEDQPEAIYGNQQEVVYGNLSEGVYENEQEAVHGNQSGVYGNRSAGVYGNQSEGVYGNQSEGAYGNQSAAVYGNQSEAMYGYQQAAAEEEQVQFPIKADSPVHDKAEVRRRGFLDLNELAPGSGFDDCPNSVMKGEDTDNF
ncbi:DDT domain-containing protein [Heracleum sosnowskyi]|uniref:DDT domain-containing protein n=1 Tax=Heracleum sosnowskyi TaxID=360622 RepID=A0AAD8M329_9APIA|nr:DDT domain-containing protein [Heracleum sosnowskyi]